MWSRKWMSFRELAVSLAIMPVAILVVVLVALQENRPIRCR